MVIYGLRNHFILYLSLFYETLTKYLKLVNL